MPPHNCPLTSDLLEFSNSLRSEAKYYCRADTVTELNITSTYSEAGTVTELHINGIVAKLVLLPSCILLPSWCCFPSGTVTEARKLSIMTKESSKYWV